MQHVVCHKLQRDSSATKSDRHEIAFTLVLFLWLRPQADEGGKETGVPEKQQKSTRLQTSLNASFLSQKIQAPIQTPIRFRVLVAKKAEVLTITPRVFSRHLPSRNVHHVYIIINSSCVGGKCFYSDQRFPGNDQKIVNMGVFVCWLVA